MHGQRPIKPHIDEDPARSVGKEENPNSFLVGVVDGHYTANAHRIAECRLPIGERVDLPRCR